MYFCAHIYKHIHTLTHMKTHIRTCVRARAHTRKHTRKHTHTHTHDHIICTTRAHGLQQYSRCMHARSRAHVSTHRSHVPPVHIPYIQTRAQMRTCVHMHTRIRKATRIYRLATLAISHTHASHTHESSAYGYVQPAMGTAKCGHTCVW